MDQTRKEKARLRSAKHRTRRKTEVEELKREAEKLRNVLEYLRANAPDHHGDLRQVSTQRSHKHSLLDENNNKIDDLD